MGYRRPWHDWPTMRDVFGSNSELNGGLTPTVLGGLHVYGRGCLVVVSATRLLPRWGEIDQGVTVGLDRRAYLNPCDIGACPPDPAAMKNRRSPVIVACLPRSKWVRRPLGPCRCLTSGFQPLPKAAQ